MSDVSVKLSDAAIRRRQLSEFWFYFSRNKGAVVGLAIAYGTFRKGRLQLISAAFEPLLGSRANGPWGKVIDMLAEGHDLRARLKENSAYFRERMSAAGFTLAGADHAIIPVMLGDAKLAAEMASRMLDAGIYVVGFSFPVVPKGQARIRTQMSAAHTREQLDKAIDAFIRIGRELGVI